eukprot:TRINITY_DN20448_c0_g1_i1.p1 TRINITY_DN20448_c0_g1~~TRINITY_DN20448_c0_g1_i1.p1  ORF type:complete len:1833 (+),score=513.23 TRINITY_DN20448_c0_g1_i1:101-5599(+)
MTTSYDLNLPFSDAEFKRVKSVRFTVLDADTIVGYSVAEVWTDNVYQGGEPIHHGVNDPRLGPIDIRSICETCGGSMRECPGHWGHLTLARPMFHWGFMRATHNVLRCVCYYCSRLLADPNDFRIVNTQKMVSNKKKLQAVMLVCRTKPRCQARPDPAEVEEEAGDGGSKDFVGGCGCKQPRYFIEATVMMVSFPEGGEEEAAGQDRKRPLTANEALTIFKRIRDKDIVRLGFNPKSNPPSCMILTHMAIPPPCVRPTISMGAARSEDDVTAKFIDIIKVNLMLKRQVQSGAGEHIVSEFAKLLQYHIYTLNDNNIIGIPQAQTKSKRPLKSIRERLKSKEGRLRGTLMGKRVDFCARSVIGGDANANTEDVYIPKSIAMNLTFAERVTPHNLDWLKYLVKNGPVKHPGARFIVRDDLSRIDLRFASDLTKMELKYGWRVERHMMDGDYVIFNRQPSLHKMSMMGHRAKVMPFSTLRFNLAVTSPYNADFDGDEMNVHLAQTHETRAEIKHMMLNPRMVVSPQGNKPVMGIVQDALLATNKYTRRDTFLEKDIAMNLLMWLPVWDGQLPIPAIIRPKEMWTGKQLLSFLIPKGLSMKRDSAIASKNKKDDPDYSASDCKVLIMNGEILSGIICKKTIGSSSGSLIHLIWLDYGPEACRHFISFLQKMVNQFLTHNGFSCGVADIIANDETLLNVEKTLKQAKAEVRNILGDAQRGKLETQPGKTMYQTFEAKVNQRLNAAREDAGRIGSESLDERNNIISMVNAGSKGSPINIAQIIACVGQQNVEGSRIRFGFTDRSLPHFRKDDYGAESKGFVENSYLGGLTPQEVYMHAMGGREGVIDTACKTSETGYIQRRLVKSMETLKVEYDGSSRNACGDIIQFLYGEDGMDGLWIEDQELDIMKYDNKKLEKTFKHDYLNDHYGQDWLPPKVRTDIKASQTHQQVLDAEWEKLRGLKNLICQEVFTDGDTKQHMPINMARLIGRAKTRALEEDRGNTAERYTPAELVNAVNKTMSELEVTRAIAEGDTIGREVEDNAKIILNAHLRCHLASRKLLEQEKLSKASVDWLLGEVKARFMRSHADPGEVVGVIAAQSVGEPATQMTLNTFHFAGVGAKNVTLGVPRLKELINVAKTVKTPSLGIYLNGDLGKSQERAKDVQSVLEHTTLEKVTSFTQIFWDPDPVNTRVLEDREWVSEYYELPDDDDNPARCGAWVLRIQLSNKVMTDKKLTVREVGQRITRDFLGDLDCIFTDDNAEELVLRIRLLKEAADMDLPPQPFDPTDDKEDKDYKFLRSIESNILKEMTLKGVLGIKKVFMREDNVSKYNEAAGKFERGKEWVLDTDGVNLEEVMQIPEVDFVRLQSNDIVEILNVLGIEAVRKALLIHVRMVISFDGSYVNYRHLGTLCDVMTNRGHLMAITRHGINRTNMGPLMKCSFEETVEILMDAAVYNEVDQMRSVSENVIMGQLCPIGTGMFDLHMDDTPSTAEHTCPLDRCNPVLPSKDAGELFSTTSGVLSPNRRSPFPEETPHQDMVDIGLQSVKDTDFPTPLVTGGEEDEGEVSGTAGNMSPFPQGEFGVRNDGLASPESPLYQAHDSMATSPHSYQGSPQSPLYSLASERAGAGPFSPGGDVSATRTPARSPAYYSEASGYDRSSRMTSPGYKPSIGKESGLTSPAMGGGDTTPLYSPSYTPGHQTAGLSSPAYMPTSPAYAGPTSAAYQMTSPMYTPTSPAYLGGDAKKQEGQDKAMFEDVTSPIEEGERPKKRGKAEPGSPVVQDIKEQSAGAGAYDVPTSPSYTMHQTHPSGFGGQREDVDLVDATELTEGVAPASELFEDSDME